RADGGRRTYGPRLRALRELYLDERYTRLARAWRPRNRARQAHAAGRRNPDRSPRRGRRVRREGRGRNRMRRHCRRRGRRATCVRRHSPFPAADGRCPGGRPVGAEIPPPPSHVQCARDRCRTLMPPLLVAVADSPFPTLDLARGVLSRIGAELQLAAEATPEAILRVAADADALLVTYAKIT